MEDKKIKSLTKVFKLCLLDKSLFISNGKVIKIIKAL